MAAAGRLHWQPMAKPSRTRTTVVTTRPSGQGVNLCRALRRRGLTAWNLPVLRLAPVRDTQAARAGLVSALAGDRIIFTSPAAVRHALAVWPRGASMRAEPIAVGASTARALRNAGMGPVALPTHASSEGLLDMASLARVRGKRIAIVGAAGGRRLLGDSLAERGAQVSRVNVYQRLPARWDARHMHALDGLRGPVVVTVTSAQSMAELAERLPAAAWQCLRSGAAVASSPRLDELARELGFSRVHRADSATDADLLAAITTLF